MSESRADFQKFLEEDLAKTRGILYPVKASFLELMFKKKASVNSLHPNPFDEFCSKEVGPSYRIISEYEAEFRKAREMEFDPFHNDSLVVEKVHPDGYMLLNGHHRWAAARNVGFQTVPVRIVNLAHESDIRKMLEASNRHKKVTFDLDEVIFDSPDGSFERVPGFLGGKYEKVRLGVPALFHFFYQNGYDIWVFSSRYYSIEYIRHLFLRYGVHVNGIVTGTAGKESANPEERKQIEELLSQKYEETITVDNEAIVRVCRGSKAFDHIPLEASDTNWSARVMDAFHCLERK